MLKELFSISSNTHGIGDVIFKWDPLGKLLATCGMNRVVHIFDRRGEIIFDFPLKAECGECMSLDWDCEGETLAVLQKDSEEIIFWSTTKKVSSLQTNLKDPSFLCWARFGPYLAIGTLKGNLLIYHKKTFKKIPIMGKHSKEITCGMWNRENYLALAGSDKMLTISDIEGTTVKQEPLKFEPYGLQFSENTSDEKKNVRESRITINMGRRYLFLYNLSDESETELQFQPKYGDVQTFSRYGDGFCLIGFQKGYVVAVDLHEREIKPGMEEVQSLKIHEFSLSDLVLSPILNQFATAGDDGVRVVDMHDWKELKSQYREFSNSEGHATHLQWTEDGQILTCSTTNGCIVSFLTSIPSLAAFNSTKIVYLSSLRNVTIIDIERQMTTAVDIEVEIEPAFLAIGKSEIAVGMNNHIWFYNINGANHAIESGASNSLEHVKLQPTLITEREYVGTVENVFINSSWTAVLCGGKAFIHSTIPNKNDENDSKTFSGDEENATITCISLVEEFIVFGTTKGTIKYFFLKDWNFVGEIRHENEISKIFVSSSGTKTVFVDSLNRGYFCNPIDNQKIQIEKFLPSIDLILWDPTDSNIFTVVDSKMKRILVTYVHNPQTIYGEIVTYVCTTKLPNSFTPISLYNGKLHGQKANGTISSFAIASHEYISGERNGLGSKAVSGGENKRQKFLQYIGVHRLKDAWEVALELKSKDIYENLARKALILLDIELSICVHQQLQDANMVMLLENIRHIEDRSLLSGHIFSILGDFQQAEKCFVNSSNPTMALLMRRDLLQWNHALKLASTLSPDEIPTICREFAQQLEFKGDYEQSLSMYEKGLIYEEKSEEDRKHNELCRAGIARTTIRIGEIATGRSLALKMGNILLLKECAVILEKMKHYRDAADFYVQAKAYEKAASIYIYTKDFSSAELLMDKITSPKLHSQYAKAKEAEGSYEKALKGYEKAQDLDSVVRIYLQYLNQPKKAFEIVRMTKSYEGAELAAQYCQKVGDYRTGIEFLILAKRGKEAFELAQNRNAMEQYSQVLGEEGSEEDYLNIALYFENTGKLGRAGDFYTKCGDFKKALKLYMQAGNEYIDSAIELIHESKESEEHDILVRTLHMFLVGEVDGEMRDPQYIFKLYVAIGDFSEAANTAVLIARQQQENGSYKEAHQTLFETHQSLIQNNVNLPDELRKALVLLHSYIVAATLVKSKLNRVPLFKIATARLLVRVSNSISKFPAHIVPILTSTVIECHRAGLRRSAFEFAALLMRREYRDQIPDSHLKNIQNLARHPPKVVEEDTFAHCPFCNVSIPNTTLDCPSCKNSLPYCIVTGCIVELKNCCFCSNCKFPANYGPFKLFLENNFICPMCNVKIDPGSIEVTNNAREILMKRSPSVSKEIDKDLEEKKN